MKTKQLFLIFIALIVANLYAQDPVEYQFFNNTSDSVEICVSEGGTTTCKTTVSANSSETFSALPTSLAIVKPKKPRSPQSSSILVGVAPFREPPAVILEAGKRKLILDQNGQIIARKR